MNRRELLHESKSVALFSLFISGYFSGGYLLCGKPFFVHYVHAKTIVKYTMKQKLVGVRHTTFQKS